MLETNVTEAGVSGGPEEAAITASALSKYYGRTRGLESLDLTVPKGTVFGYLGPNGSGKTTTIRLLVGLLRPSGGSATVLGLDVIEHRDEVQGRIGYLPGEFVAYPDLTGKQYLRYLGNLRGGVSWVRTAEIADRLGLDLNTRIGSLSHGNRQKVGLVQAMMHDPEILILDEPSLGLDPLVQREFLAIIRDAKERGRTVFLSSHILDEVEAIADSVGILRDGRLVIVGSMETLKSQAIRRLELTFEREVPIEALRNVEGVKDVSVTDGSALLVVEGSTSELVRMAAPFGVRNVRTIEADLEQIFLDFYGIGG